MSSTITALTSGGGLAMAGDTSGQLELKTNNGTTAVTVTTAQDVGIGTGSPTTKAQVSATTGGSTTGLSVVASGNMLNVFGSSSTGAGVILDATNGTVGSATAVELLFRGGGTERMRIGSDGNIAMGTASTNGKLIVNQTDTGARTITASAPASYAATLFRSDSAATSGTGWYHLYGSSSGGVVNNIFIYGNGNIQNANNSYGAISDIKLKENIVDATPKLDKLLQVKVRNYNLKGDYEQHKQIGVIAQELETIFPSLIEETQDRGENDELLETTTKSVKYSVFVPMLIKALQELNAKVDAQALEIQALKGVA